MLQTLVSIIAVPFAVAAVVLFLSPRWAGRVALLAPAVVLALALPLWPEAASGDATLVPIPWFPSLGINADLRLDRLGAFFVLLIGGIGLGVVQYARFYLGEKGKASFWAMLLAFMGAMLGIVLSDSLILLFVFWELTTITSALLIGMDFEEAEGRRGAVQAFLVTGGGGLAMLAGIVLLGEMAGSYNVSGLEARAGAIVGDPAHVFPLVLLLLGAFTKSAQFPFHFWLPGAMAAPAPVSAYLHSATMVKAGIFLLGRLFPVFQESPIWLPLLATVGLTTFLVAGWNAIRAWDLKQLLAWSTVAYLGVLTALYGFYARVGTHGEILNIANHALYKSSLFLLVGWLEKATGTRDLAVLERERWLRREPVGAALIGVGALAMAGVPFLLGFMSKETFYEAVIGESFEGLTLALGIAVLASALAMTYALKLLVGTFGGPERPPEGRGYPPNKISAWLLIVPGVLLVPQVVGGVVPGWFLGSVLEPGSSWPEGFALWHHMDVLLALSLSTFTLGIGGFFIWRRLAAIPVPPGPQRASDGLAHGALVFSEWLGGAIQRGGHPRFISVILLASVAAMAGGVLWSGEALRLLPAHRGPDAGIAWLPAATIVGAALLAVWIPQRIAKVIMMAIVGYGMAVFYVMFRAPDLALTQILVETVSLILLLLIFRRMPELGRDTRRMGQKAAHFAVAGVVGGAMAALTWAAGTHEAVRRAGYEQLDLSLPVAKGSNVVNVILVDFRGVDTFGEITVLAIATLGAVALFRARRQTDEARGEGVE
jgi:NADH:ubiquinone oxidoreductase subunit 5 (subunit L)/multisubunit Na+/H+ antiporter MnhA subunit/multisubunit Na+/H+ antiporter MnhB subunit